MAARLSVLIAKPVTSLPSLGFRREELQTCMDKSKFLAFGIIP